MAPLRPLTSVGDYIFLRITEPKTNGVLIRSTENAELSMAVCGNCGYGEYYVADAARLWKYWQRHYR